jgi:hypothetical protein
LRSGVSKLSRHPVPFYRFNSIFGHTFAGSIKYTLSIRRRGMTIQRR